MKLIHDIENDLQHTIPEVGGEDSQRLFEAMTERSLSLLEVSDTQCVVDLACGMGQDSQAIAQRMTGNGGTSPLALAVEPSHRMIRFAQQQFRERKRTVTTALPGGGRVVYLRALGEEIPLKNNSVDAVLCKGSLDHFMDPSLTMKEIARVLRPNGRVVISLANYDSLSCRLGRWGDQLKRWLAPGFAPAEHPYYNPPPDHLTRFGYGSIKKLPQSPLHLKRLEGVSMLWGLPLWGKVLGFAPPFLRPHLISIAFLLGRILPFWADVVVIQAVKLKHGEDAP